jgi:TatD DNase family protein
MEMIDAHAHITDEWFDDVQQVIERAKESGVGTIVCSSYNFLSSQKAVELASKYDNVYANVGFHPENVDEIEENSLFLLEKLAKNKKVVAIGEIGLDFHREGFDKEKQKKFFVEQIELANKLNLPIVVHSRDAMEKTIEILKNHPPKRESLIHCFSGSVESAKILLGLGFSFSIGGVVTFKNARALPDVVKILPKDRILLETDCPYMTPVPFRGQRNEPKNVVYIADEISRIRGESIEEVAKFSTENAKRLFNL